jgi:hypothetical protein
VDTAGETLATRLGETTAELAGTGMGSDATVDAGAAAAPAL